MIGEARTTLELRLVQGPGAGRAVGLRTGENLVGRGTSRVHVRIESEAVSRRHLVLFRDGDAVVARDLASRNGTLLNGQRLVGTQPLAVGDRLQVGDVVLELGVPEPVADPAAVSVGAGATAGPASGPVPAGPSTSGVPVTTAALGVQEGRAREQPRGGEVPSRGGWFGGLRGRRTGRP